MMETSAVRRLAVSEHRKELLFLLNEQRLNGTFCDVTIQVENHAFCMHRCVLAASSPVLKAFFCGDGADGDNKLSFLESISAVAFGKVMDFMYSGCMDIDNDSLEAVLNVAKCLELSRLVEMISTHLQGCKPESKHGDIECGDQQSRTSSSADSQFIVDVSAVKPGPVVGLEITSSRATDVQPDGDLSSQSRQTSPPRCQLVVEKSSDTTERCVKSEQTCISSGTHGDSPETSDSSSSTYSANIENVPSVNTGALSKVTANGNIEVATDIGSALPGNSDTVSMINVVEKIPCSPLAVSSSENDTNNHSVSESLEGDEQAKHGGLLTLSDSGKCESSCDSSQTASQAVSKTAKISYENDGKIAEEITKINDESLELLTKVSASTKKCVTAETRKSSRKISVPLKLSPVNVSKGSDISQKSTSGVDAVCSPNSPCRAVSCHSMGTRSKKKDLERKENLKSKKKLVEESSARVPKSKISNKKRKPKNSKIEDAELDRKPDNKQRHAQRKRKIMDDVFVYDMPNIRSKRSRRGEQKIEMDEQKDPTKTSTPEMEDSETSLGEDNAVKSECVVNKGEYEKSVKNKNADDGRQLSAAFVCKQCDQTFTKKSLLLFHASSHMESRQFACEHCEMRFTVKQNLRRHIMRMHTDSRPFECKTCTKTFKCNGDLQFHINSKHSLSKVFECPECNVKFRNYTSLRIHQRTHESVKSTCEQCRLVFATKSHLRQHECSASLQCEQCNMVFRKYGPWKRHLYNHSKKTDGGKPFLKTGEGTRAFVCAVCSEDFEKKSDLLEHIQKHGDVKPFTCSTCCKSFSSENYLRNHERTHEAGGAKPYVCSLCSKSFMMNSNLKRHVLTIHQNLKPYPCSHCGKSFADKAALRTHVLVHTGERPHKCTQCFKSFSTFSNLNVHLKLHNDPKPFKCDKCSKAFTMKSQLNRHKKQHAGPENLTCVTCDVTLPNSNQYNKHLREHRLGKRPYVCDVCGNQFTALNGLMYHMLIHTGEKPYVCDVCNKRFRSTTSLSGHRKIHTGEKSFMCEICGEKFISKASLRSHGRIHMTHKAFSCDKCSQRFHFSYDLKRHMICHEDAKPFTCALCSKNFKRRIHLERHWVVHLGHKPFSCSWCSEKFLTTPILKEHIQRAHNVSEEDAWASTEAEEIRAKATARFVKAPYVDKSRYIKTQVIAQASSSAVQVVQREVPVLQGDEAFVDGSAQVLECVEQGVDDKSLVAVPHQVNLSDVGGYEALGDAQQIFDASQFDPEHVQVHIAENVEGLQDGETYVFVQLDTVDVVIPNAEEFTVLPSSDN